MAAVELSGVSVTMNEEGKRADLALTVERGELAAFVGPNRSGKSLILKLCAGLVVPEAGTVRVLDRNLAELTEDEWDALRLRMGVVLQQPGLLSNMTVYNNVALPLRYHRALPEPEVERAVMARLEALGLAYARNRFPAQLNQGEARAAAIARALVMDPDLLLLDGPGEGLDAEMEARLGGLLAGTRRARALTILVTLHDYSPLLDAVDRVAFVRDGRVERMGSYAELLAGADPGMKPYLDPRATAGQHSTGENEVSR